MKIRIGTISDLSDVQRLNQALFVYEQDQILRSKMNNVEWPYQPAGTKYFTECLRGENNYVVVIAEIDGQPIGYLAAFCRSYAYIHENPIAEIDNMFVEQSHRGKGVGTLLIGQFKKWASGRGAAHLQVNAYAGNPAIGFYKKNGFNDFAVRLTQPSSKVVS